MKRILTIGILGTLAYQHAAAQGSTFYDPTTIQTIRIQFARSDWDYMLDSAATAGDNYSTAATVIIGQDTFQDVGVKYKGNSTFNVNNTKNSMAVKLDFVHNGQDYEGLQSIKLNNCFKDPTFTREVLGYEIARKYMPAPRANYAKVYVNGNYHGLYVSVEDVNKDFLGQHFENNDGSHFKCDPAQGTTLPSGCTNGGSALEYLGTDTTCYYNRYEINSDYGWARLRNLTNVLNNQTSSVATVLDVDRALWMLAFNNAFVNLDSYTGSGHNYYVYEDNNARFNTIIWDLNEVFGVFINGGGTPLTVAQMKTLSPTFNSTANNRPLIQKLLQNASYKKAYIAHLRTIMNENVHNGLYMTRVSAMQTLIDADVQADPNKLYSYTSFQQNPTATANGVVGMSELMSPRDSFLQAHAEFQNVPPTIASVIAPATANAGSAITITAEVSNQTSVKLRFRGNTYAVFQQVDMFDDGAHGDGAASDGVFGAQVTVPSSGLQYYVYSENANAAMFSPERAEYEFYTVLTNNTAGDLVINEIMASNTSTAQDEYNEFDDWVELYNNSTAAISLSGKYLSDNFGNPTKWAFPNVSIPAGGYLIVWLDDDSTQMGGNALHAGFKLSSGGEELAIFDSFGGILDSVSFGAQTADVSFGRYVNGTGNFTTMPPTFRAQNSLTIAVREVASPTLSYTIFPNPARSGSFFVRSSQEIAGELRLQLQDGMGRVAYQTTLQNLPADSPQQIHVGDLPAGLYFLTLHSANGMETVKIVLQP